MKKEGSIFHTVPFSKTYSPSLKLCNWPSSLVDYLPQCIILSMVFTATTVGLCERGAVIIHEKLFTLIATYKQLKHSTKISTSGL